MAPLPKRRHSTQRSRKREQVKSVNKLGLHVCPNCKKLTPPHRACVHCGEYKKVSK